MLDLGAVIKRDMEHVGAVKDVKDRAYLLLLLAASFFIHTLRHFVLIHARHCRDCPKGARNA